LKSDQNLQETYGRYKNLVPGNCKLLFGAQYALLRPEFIDARKKARIRNGNVNNILIFFGGTDLTNETEKAINALQNLPLNNFSATIIVGRNNPYRSQIETLCMQFSNFSYRCQVDNIAELMVHSDLAIGAGGTTAWERCAMGLPSIMISVANNQDSICSYLQKAGAAFFLGKQEFVSA